MWKQITNYIFLKKFTATIESNNIDSKYRIRLYQYSTLFFLLIYLIYMSFVPIYKDRQWSNNYSAILIHLLFLSGFINYLILNYTHQYKFAYGYNIILYLTLLHVLSYNSGGIRNSGNAFMLSIIFNAFILLGKRFGLFITFLCIANLLYFYGVNKYTNWIDFSYFKNDNQTVSLDYLITLSIGIISIWFQARFLFLIHHAIIDKVNNSNKIILDNELKTQKQNQLIAENELKALRAQMNPHFTYNVMNNIQFFLLNNQHDDAITYLSKFSKLNRIILNNGTAKYISLADELVALNMYVELEQMRFDTALKFETFIDSSIQPNKCYLPSMILQPFIENSIKHGFTKNETNRIISINVNNNYDQTIAIIITDNGIGIEASKQLKANNISGVYHKNHGLDITKERIKLLAAQYPNKAAIAIIDGSGNGQHGTTIKLTLPLIDQMF